jgi:hypothetical protein
MLYHGEKVYDDPSKAVELVGNGRIVVVGGENRLLSAMPKPEGHDTREYSRAFGAEIPTIPRSDWSARLKEQFERRARVSDYQTWPSDNQGAHPICWAAGTVAAASTGRVIQGLPFVRLSAGCIATEVTGGVSSGGYEGNAVKVINKRGVPSAEVWGYQSSRPTGSAAEVAASREHFVGLEGHECEGFDEFATAWLLTLPTTQSYNWWRHVVMGCDLVEIEAGSFGVRIRNNWGESYGAKNEHGVGGYAVFREGKGTPSGGFAFRQMMPSTGAA